MTSIPRALETRTATAVHSSRRRHAVMAALAAMLVVAFAVSLTISSVWIAPARVLSILAGADASSATDYILIHDVRLPRALTALLAGAALGIAGLQMQTLFRNPLADPYAMGIASGSSLGVALVLLGSGTTVSMVLESTTSLAGDALITLASILGAAASVGVVLALSRRIENSATVLIFGLMLGYATQAFVTVLVAGSNPDKLQRWVAWGFGSFAGVGWSRMALFFPLIAGALLIAGLTTKQLNALLLGESYALSMGLNVRRLRLVIILSASILSGVVTAFCGPIAFVGVAIPHMCRGILGTSDHRELVPATMLLGGTVALAAQVLALAPSAIPGNSGILPINAVTSLIGAPVVVLVLLRARKAGQLS